MESKRFSDLSIDPTNLRSLIEITDHMYGTIFTNVTFKDLKLNNFRLAWASFEDCHFFNLDCSEIHLDGCSFFNCQFHTITAAQLHVEGCFFHNTSLLQSNFESFSCSCLSCYQFKLQASLNKSSISFSNIIASDLSKLSCSELHLDTIYYDSTSSLPLELAGHSELHLLKKDPNKIMVGLIGAPIVGKRTLLQALIKQAGSKEKLRFQEWGEFGGWIVEGDLKLKGQQLGLIATSSVDLFLHPRLVYLLQQSDLLVYVHVQAERFHRDQTEYLNQLFSYLSLFKKTWQDIPWLIVFNKADWKPEHTQQLEQTDSSLATQLDIYELIKQQDIPVIETIAMTGSGVAELLDRLGEALEKVGK